jgi:hypothetical protein
LAKANYIHTPSVVFRRNEEVFKTFLELGNLPVGDYVLHLLNARYGKIKKLRNVMAVYRANVGIWSTKSSEFLYLNWLKLLDVLMTFFKENDKLIQILTYQYGQMAFGLYNVYKIENNIEKEKFYFMQTCLNNPDLIRNNISMLEKELQSIKSAKAYRLGKFLLNPFSVLKKIQKIFGNYLRHKN